MIPSVPSMAWLRPLALLSLLASVTLTSTTAQRPITHPPTLSVTTTLTTTIVSTVRCGEQMFADVAAGGSLTAAFAVPAPAASLSSATFSASSGTAADTVLTVNGVEMDNAINVHRRGRLTIQLADRPAGATVPVELRFQSTGVSGTLQLDVACRRRSTPTVVISGVGDSGTRGVHDYVEHALGVSLCAGKEKNRTRDCKPTTVCHGQEIAGSGSGARWSAIHKLLKGSVGTGHADLNMIEASTLEFEKAVACERRASQLARGPDGAPWGYKNPKHAYLAKVVAKAFDNRTAQLFVVRHPFDVCTGHNSGQYLRLGNTSDIFLPRQAYRQEEFDVLAHCVEWWATIHTQLLEFARSMPRVRLLRIESLALGSPEQQAASGHCIASLLGIPFRPAEAFTAARTVALHNASYGGGPGHGHSAGSSHRTSARKWLSKRLLNETSKDEAHLSARFGGLLLPVTLRSLGYSLRSWGAYSDASTEFLLPPESPWLVC